MRNTRDLRWTGMFLFNPKTPYRQEVTHGQYGPSIPTTQAPAQRRFHRSILPGTRGRAARLSPRGPRVPPLFLDARRHDSDLPAPDHAPQLRLPAGGADDARRLRRG